MRNYLKQIARKLPEMQQEVEIQYTINGRTVKNDVPKYELVHLHSARRTLATILYRRNIQIEKIMMVTGHKNVKSLKLYLKVTEGVLNEIISSFETSK